MLLGLIALLQQDHTAACKAFQQTVTRADALLGHTPGLLSALDTRALALCGLVLCGEPQHLAAAGETFHKARAISSAAGIVQRTLLLLDQMIKTDSKGLLQGMREQAGA